MVQEPDHICLTKNHIREIIRSELYNIFRSEINGMIKNTISSEIRYVESEVVTLKKELISKKESMEFINQQYEKVKIDSIKNNRENTRLLKEAAEMKTLNIELKNRLE
ncbi:unnamed protein product [Parnassius apollo]|uniref:(apollo) hypothetical protein n=1 Tax=Parnassius apollo TaxID=110799 RepID=A0A8S3XAW5_PARAO|nr:unnamed protein product [Parnassius apollo]